MGICFTRAGTLRVLRLSRRSPSPKAIYSWPPPLVVRGAYAPVDLKTPGARALRPLSLLDNGAETGYNFFEGEWVREGNG